MARVYGHRGTNWINAAPFFFKKDDNIPAADKNPQLHRYTAGGDLGGPIIKDKLFGFVSYQHLHISDQETGDELLDRPARIERHQPHSPADSRDIANNNWTTNEGTQRRHSQPPANVAVQTPSASRFSICRRVPGEPGKCLVPNQNAPGSPNVFSPYNAFLPGTARFTSDQAVADLDWNVSAKDVLAAKYYYQHDPTHRPTPTRTCPALPRTWTPAPRWARSTMCRPSEPV